MCLIAYQLLWMLHWKISLKIDGKKRLLSYNLTLNINLRANNAIRGIDWLSNWLIQENPGCPLATFVIDHVGQANSLNGQQEKVKVWPRRLNKNIQSQLANFHLPEVLSNVCKGCFKRTISNVFDIKANLKKGINDAQKRTILVCLCNKRCQQASFLQVIAHSRICWREKSFVRP